MIGRLSTRARARYAQHSYSKKAIRRLRLRPGDIIIVADEYAMRNIADGGLEIKGLNFNVPIIFAPDGIQRVNRRYLQKVLASPIYPKGEEEDANRSR